MTVISLPEDFAARVRGDLGETEGRALCAALDRIPPVSVRLNPAKVSWGPLAVLDEAVLPAQTAGSEAADACGRTEDGAEALPESSVRAAGNPMGNEPDPKAAQACSMRNGGGDAVGTAEGTRGNALCTSDRGPDGEKRKGGQEADAPVATSQGVEGGPVPEPLPHEARIPWSPEGYYLARRPQFTFDPDFHAGAYYVQEAGSQFVGYLLTQVPTKGCRVLDLCAAPGGKTTLYASLAGPDGLVVANEVDKRRAQVLADNVRKWGTGNVAVTVSDPERLGAFEAWFDVVAVDAPCSGEGMFRKDEAARAAWSAGNVRLCASRQGDILRAAWQALRPGGLLVYSTCTFNRTENEEVLETFAAGVGAQLIEAGPVDTEPAWGIVCGRAAAFQTFRFYPHRARGEGFFAAVARKAPQADARTRMPRATRAVWGPVTRSETQELARWIERAERMQFVRVGEDCYALTQVQAGAVRHLAEVLPVICCGVEMGRIFKGQLRPAHALALYEGLDRKAVAVAEVTPEQAVEYLRRRDVDPGLLAEGMNLVVCRGRPLGWAKRIGGRVNNLYPHSLKIIKN